MKYNKGQVALEALIVFGILVVGVIIFSIFFMGNVREFTTADIGIKQDKNEPGTGFDDIEGALIYDGPDQIGSSDFGITDNLGGTGGSGGNGDSGDEGEGDDGEAGYCGDNICQANIGENLLTCPEDCSGNTYTNPDLNLTLSPETSSYTDELFDLIVSLDTTFQVNLDYIKIYKKEFDLFLGMENYVPTTNCKLNGSENYLSEYTDLGLLVYNSETQKSIKNLSFSCLVSGNYDFEVKVSFVDEPSNNIVSSILQKYPSGKIIEEEQILAFVSKWDTTKTYLYDNNSSQISLPLVSDGTYDFIVDWGDETTSHITSWNQLEKKHTYENPGIYTLTITGTINGFNYGADPQNKTNNAELIEIMQWGILKLGNSGHYFEGCEFEIIATDNLDLSDTTDLSWMFADSSVIFNSSISNWDVSNVIDMTKMFYRNDNFNISIGEWDVSNVLYMSEMFLFNFSFNQPLNWDTSNVQDMSKMFYYASEFNQPLNWNTSNVTNMSNMFSGASSFNQDIGDWDVSNVTDLSEMFNGASSFNKDIGDWNVSNVINMGSLFSYAGSFNQDLEKWNVSNVTNMAYMFSGASSFNQDISSWDVSNVVDMAGMFSGTSSFDHPLNWNTSNVTNMSSMFSGASSFDHPLNWDTFNVTNMYSMFSGASSFDQDIGSWNVSNVTNMAGMFNGASSFNQDISSWSVDRVASWFYIFYDCPILENYKPARFI